MATQDKKYLDLTGLQKLIDEKAIVKHPTNTAANPAAVKVGTDANGHVVIGGALSYNDLANRPTIGNGTLTIQANGTSKGTFTANQTGNQTINITAADLGLSSALSFAGTTTTALTDGSTTNPIQIEGKNYTATKGNVVLYNDKEFIWTGTLWEELGDEASHALKSIKISGDGMYITGGGTLEANRTLSHKTYDAADAAIVKVGRDSGGHVILGGAITVGSNGAHTHSVTGNVPANTYLESVTGSSTKLSVNKTTANVVSSVPGVSSKLVTASITGVSGSTTASKATAGTSVAVAKAGTAVTVATLADATGIVGTANVAATPTTVGNANVGAAVTYGTADVGSAVTYGNADVGTAVVYGTADVGTSATVATKAASATTVGNANVASTQSTFVTTLNGTAYSAAYDSTNECLNLTALSPSTGNIYGAVASSTSIYGVGGTTTVTSAKAADTTRKITPAVASTKTLTPAVASKKTLTPAAASSTTIYGAVASTATIADYIGTASVTPAVSNGTITPYTFADVTVPKAASATTVATGALSTTGTGGAVLTGLGTIGTTAVLTGATLASGTTGDVAVITGVSGTKKATAVAITGGSAASSGGHTHDLA